MNKSFLFFSVTVLVVVIIIGGISIMKAHGYYVVQTTYASEKPFISVYQCDRYEIMVDRHNGVMYNMSKDGIITLLVNDDGSPRIYESWPECTSQ